MLVRFYNWLISPEIPQCKICEELKSLLEIERYERKQLLNAILDERKPKDVVPQQAEIPRELNSKPIPWRVRQQLLEKEDREKARIMRELEAQNKAAGIPVLSIDELEHELGVAENAKEGG